MSDDGLRGVAYHEVRVQGEKLIKNLLAVLIVLAGCGAASAQEHKTYRCKIADVVTLAEDGRLSTEDRTMRLLYEGAIIDTLTGAVTYRDGTRQVWKVIQEGSGVSDYVLALNALDPVVAATDFIRVRAWKENPIVRFMVFGLSTLASGPCEVVR